MSFLLNKFVNWDGEMELKFLVYAFFLLRMIMFSVMSTPVNGEKFSLAAISNLVQGIIKYYQVTLFSLQILKCCVFSLGFYLILVILMIGTCKISSAESYEYVFERAERDIVSKVASGLHQQDNYFNGNINKEGVQNSAHLCDLNSQNEVCYASWYIVIFTGGWPF